MISLSSSVEGASLYSIIYSIMSCSSICFAIFTSDRRLLKGALFSFFFQSYFEHHRRLWNSALHSSFLIPLTIISTSLPMLWPFISWGRGILSHEIDLFLSISIIVSKWWSYVNLVEKCKRWNKYLFRYTWYLMLEDKYQKMSESFDVYTENCQS